MPRRREVPKREILPDPKFGSVDLAFQFLCARERVKARDAVHQQIRSHVSQILPYPDFLVLDEKPTVLIQPAVPVPNGYECY